MRVFVRLIGDGSDQPSGVKESEEAVINYQFKNSTVADYRQEDLAALQVKCSRCAWRGKAITATAKPNNLVRCPSCTALVERE